MKVVYNDLLDFDKIYEQYLTIRKNTRNRNKIVNYEVFLASNLINIYNRLKTHSYCHGKYNIFLINDPKYRIIMSEVMNDKVVNHLVSNYVLIPLIEPRLCASNIATRKNMGTIKGIRMTLNYLNKLKLNNDKVYVLKMDIKKYFFNIDHEILLNKLRTLIEDDDIYLLIENIIRSSDETYINQTINSQKKLAKMRISKMNIKDKNIHLKKIDKLPEYKLHKGLGIGNLSSQILAIFYLNDIDHFIKEKLKCKYYIRYMDDMVVFSSDKERLKYIKLEVEKKLKLLKLELNEKTNIYDLNHGFTFLGYRFKLVDKKLIIRVNNQSKNRIKRKIKYLKIYDLEKLKRVRASYNGYLLISNLNSKVILK